MSRIEDLTHLNCPISLASFYPVKMLQTPLHIYALLLMSLLITDGVNGIHFFKGAPNQFRKRKSIDREPDNSLAWCSRSCNTAICRVKAVDGRSDRYYGDCDCGVHCYCVYSETRGSNYFYRCTPV
ncbi:unnamed protein product [Porites lobata]|uniref:Defensin n=1 Tax=Porites lobata TaxID=104759 RepID=A0ABN8N213_9CNID|nr:unnamed protein product [Porites lobata]